MPFSGFQDFNPDFGSALQQMIAARPGISVFSGYRSPERQAELYAAAIRKYGSEEKARHWVAPPGHSMHNKGLGADLRFATDEDRRWAHENAAQFGLNFRMGHEPWHIELINGKNVAVGNQSGQPVAPAGEVPTAHGQIAPEREREIMNGNNSEFIIPDAVGAGGGLPPGAIAQGPQDIQALANLITPNRQDRQSKASRVLSQIRGYDT